MKSETESWQVPKKASGPRCQEKFSSLDGLLRSAKTSKMTEVEIDWAHAELPPG